MERSKILYACKKYFSSSWREQYGSFLEPEHWSVFVTNLSQLLEEGNFGTLLPPFDEEIHVDKKNIKIQFEKTYLSTLQIEENNDELLQKWAITVEKAPFHHLLTILGQRFTSASVKDEKAIPPLKETLLKSAFLPFNTQISVATRAWEKHVGRLEDSFWGEVKGGPREKEVKVRKLIEHIIENKTWWNIFHHYSHGLVYEVRVPSGHGIRWNATGTELIGFLENFLNEEKKEL